MNLKLYFSSTYSLLKCIFNKTQCLDNNIIIGVVREHIINNMLSFFPESKETGWIFDEDQKTTGHIDIILCLNKAMRIPGTVVGNNSLQNGLFATQVCIAFEVKSDISSHMDKIITKTWECHRLDGGDRTGTEEEFKDKKYNINIPRYVPICIVGNKGFDNVGKYLEHFNKWNAGEYSVNTEKIEKPTSIDQIIPDLLIDFDHDILLVKNYLQPELIKSCFALKEDSITKNGYFTIFNNMTSGQSLMALVFYIDSIRNNLLIRQITFGTPLLSLFKD